MPSLFCQHEASACVCALLTSDAALSTTLRLVMGNTNVGSLLGTCHTYEPAERVLLHVKNENWNGQKATIIRFDDRVDRWVVRLLNSGEIIAVRSNSLTPDLECKTCSLGGAEGEVQYSISDADLVLPSPVPLGDREVGDKADMFSMLQRVRSKFKSCFEVHIRREGAQWSNIGMVLSTNADEPDILSIDEVDEESLLSEWNASQGEALQVRAGHLVVGVNGWSGDANDMLSLIQCSKKGAHLVFNITARET